MLNWKGVWPALTTPFEPSGEIDHGFLRRHLSWLLRSGCAGAIVLGSLGEAPTLNPAEKRAVIDSAVQTAAGRAPVVAGVSGLSSAESVRLARDAEGLGVAGLMVLPPYVYRGDWRETRAHLAAVMAATELPCLLYNNPVAYGTDILPGQVEELVTEHSNLTAVKESSGDVRRIAELARRAPRTVDLFVGIDDQVLEGIASGATGWVSGLANALPRASLTLFDLARTGQSSEAQKLHRWFLPLLHLDADPKFVQMIKLVQHELGLGDTRVRPPRLELEGAELARVVALIRGALAEQPRTSTTDLPFPIAE